MKNLFLITAFVMVLLVTVSCSSKGASTDADNPTNDTVLQSDNDNQTDELGFDVSKYSATFEKFAATVHASAVSGVTGTVFDLKTVVTGGAPEGTLSYAWTIPAQGTLQKGTAANAKDISISFSEAGSYLVELAVTDAKSVTIKTGALLIVFNAAANYTVGDLNADGAVDAADKALLENYLEGNEKLTDEQIKKADINLDNKVDSVDVVILGTANGGATPKVLANGFAAAGDPIMNIAAGDPIMYAAAGDPIMIIDPLLANPAKTMSLSLETTEAGSWDNECLAAMTGKEGTETVIFGTTKPGYATFALPVKYSCLTSEEKVKITLSDGTNSSVVAEAFTIKPLPAADAVPGKTMMQSMARLRKAIEVMDQGAAAYADNIEAPVEGKHVMQGMMKAAGEMFNEGYGQFYHAFNQLTPEAKQLWDRYAKAQGIDALNTQLEKATEEIVYHTAVLQKAAYFKAGVGSPAIGESLIKLICAFRDVADISSKIGEINESISSVLSYLDWYPLKAAPIVGPAIQFLSGLSNIVGAVADIIAIVADFVPKLGDIKVEATNKKMMIGDKTQLHASIKVMVVSGLCNKAAGGAIDKLMDKLKDMLSKRIGGMIPVAGKLFKAANFDKEKMGWVTGKVYSAVGWLAGKVLDATGLKEYMEKLAAKFCDLFGNPFMAISAEFLKASCSTITFANGIGTWVCVKNCAGTPGGVDYSGNKKVCDADKPGKTTAECWTTQPTDDDTVKPDSDTQEQPDTDTPSAQTETLFKESTYYHVNNDGSSNAITPVWNNGSAPAGTSGNYDIYYSSTFPETEKPPVCTSIKPLYFSISGTSGTVLHGATKAGAKTFFYFDFKPGYTSAADAPAAAIMTGEDWSSYVLVKDGSVSSGMDQNQEPMGSYYYMVQFPETAEGQYQFYVTLVKKDQAGGPDLTKTGLYAQFDLKILPKDATFIECWSDQECSASGLKCDLTYHYCVAP